MESSKFCKIVSFSRNFIDVEVQLDNHSLWRLTGVCGVLEHIRRHQAWNMLIQLASKSTLPRCCIGDFTDILFSHEKKGRVPHSNWLLRGFHDTISVCGLYGLGVSIHVGKRPKNEKFGGGKIG
ncbi:conserved hypothetical protein [Ricinus communis]|uniref:Uncharacterized protein n=1 Tax=Ricinus communis TaxID=3988 RepID=B9SR73_RICCO|nr:conserved hypothetical protein [Ricinus communis]